MKLRSYVTTLWMMIAYCMQDWGVVRKYNRYTLERCPERGYRCKHIREVRGAVSTVLGYGCMAVLFIGLLIMGMGLDDGTTFYLRR